MSKITFQCYSCSQTLRVDADKAGKKAKCPGCATLLTIPVASTEPEAVEAIAPQASAPAAVPPPMKPASAPAMPVAQAVEDDLEEIGPAEQKKKKSGNKWLWTRIGLLTMAIAIGIVLLVTLFDQISQLLHMIDQISGMNSSMSSPYRPSDAWRTLGQISGIMFLVVVLPSYAGNGMLLAGPKNNGVLVGAAGAVLLGLLGWLFYLLFHLLPLYGNYIIKFTFSMDGGDNFGPRFGQLFFYELLPRIGLALPLLCTGVQLFAMTNVIKERGQGKMTALGACGAIGLGLILWLLVNLIFLFVKPTSIDTIKTLIYVRWGMYWVYALLQIGGLAGLIFAAIQVRGGTR